MPDLHITAHALQRYVERVSPVSEAEARQALSTRTIRLAADQGAPFVKLGTGQHVVIKQHRVITVLPSDTHPSALRTARDRIHRRNV